MWTGGEQEALIEEASWPGPQNWIIDGGGGPYLILAVFQLGLSRIQAQQSVLIKSLGMATLFWI